MNATEYGESDYITAEIVKASPTKNLTILGDAKVEETDFGSKLEIPVEIDSKKKKYRPNKDTIKNLCQVLGAETKAWIGKTIHVQTVSINGKDSVIGVVNK